MAKRDRAAQECRLLVIVDLADVFDKPAVHHRLDRLVVVVAIIAIDLGGDLQGDAAMLGDADGGIEPLLRRDTPKEREIGRLGGLRHQQAFRQPMNKRKIKATHAYKKIEPF